MNHKSPGCRRCQLTQSHTPEKTRDDLIRWLALCELTFSPGASISTPTKRPQLSVSMLVQYGISTSSVSPCRTAANRSFFLPRALLLAIERGGSEA
jgi:hypothetical protein